MKCAVDQLDAEGFVDFGVGSDSEECIGGEFGRRGVGELDNAVEVGWKFGTLGGCRSKKTKRRHEWRRGTQEISEVLSQGVSANFFHRAAEETHGICTDFTSRCIGTRRLAKLAR